MSEEKPIESMSVEECEREINATLGDYNSLYWTRKDHPLHDQAVERMRQLHEKAFPREPEAPKKEKGTRYLAGDADDLGLKQALEGVTEEDIEEAERKREEQAEEEDLEADLDADEKRALSELKAEWGPEYKARCDLAATAVDMIAEKYGEDLVDLLEDYRLGNHPTLIKFFYRIAEDLKRNGVIE